MSTRERMFKHGVEGDRDVMRAAERLGISRPTLKRNLATLGPKDE